MARQENFLSSIVSCVIRLHWCSSLISIHSQFQVLIQSHRKFAVSANYRKITANDVCFMSWEEEGNVPLISQLSQIGCSLGFFVIIQIWKSVYNFFVHHSLSNNSVDLHPLQTLLPWGPRGRTCGSYCGCSPVALEGVCGGCRGSSGKRVSRSCGGNPRQIIKEGVPVLGYRLRAWLAQCVLYCMLSPMTPVFRVNTHDEIQTGKTIILT